MVKRAPEFLFHLAAVLSLSLCLAALVLWAFGWLIVYAPLIRSQPRLDPHWTPRWTELVIPWWYAVVVTALLPALSLRRLIARFVKPRRRAGCCAQCGYDLRATPER